MIIYHESEADYIEFPEQLKRESWDYFVDLEGVSSVTEMWQRFCTDLNSKRMGPLREHTNFNYFNDMMVEFFVDRAFKETSIAVFPANPVFQFGMKYSLSIVSTLHRAHTTGTMHAIISCNESYNLNEIKRLIGSSTCIYFIEK